MLSTNGHGPERAILYARVSIYEQARSGYSLAQQIEALRAFGSRRGTRSSRRCKTPDRAVLASRGPEWTA